MTTTSTSEPQKDEDWDKDLTLPPPTAEWKHFVIQLNQDRGEGSITDLGLGTVVMEKGDAEVDTGDAEVNTGDAEVNTAGDEEVEMVKPQQM